jgi:hypothetical protein
MSCLTVLKKRELNYDQKLTNILRSLTDENAAAANERFGVIAAVIPEIMQCKLASYNPAGSSVEAATSQSRHPVARNRMAKFQHRNLGLK